MRFVPVAISVDVDELEIVVTLAWIDAGMVDAGEALRMVILPSALVLDISLN